MLSDSKVNENNYVCVKLVNIWDFITYELINECYQILYKTNND